MRHYETAEHDRYLLDASYHAMALMFWGDMPLPFGSELLGGYSDNRGTGALMVLSSGNWACGKNGEIRVIKRPKELRDCEQKKNICRAV